MHERVKTATLISRMGKGHFLVGVSKNTRLKQLKKEPCGAPLCEDTPGGAQMSPHPWRPEWSEAVNTEHCGKLGHSMKNCSNVKKGQPPSGNGNGKSGQGSKSKGKDDEAQPECVGCGKTGHMKKGLSQLQTQRWTQPCVTSGNGGTRERSWRSLQCVQSSA